MNSTEEQGKRLHKKISMQDFFNLCKELELSEKHLSKILKLTDKKLSIRKKEGFLSLSESNQCFQIKKIYKKALEVFQDEIFTKKWLKKPYWLLNDSTPIEFTETESGVQELEDILYFIEKGAFSFALSI